MKTTRTLGTLLAAAVAGSTVLALAAPASAQTVSVGDKRGDARPAIDMTRATYVNRDDVVWARLKVRDLRWKGSFDLYLSTVDPEEDTVHLNLTAHRNHTVTRYWENMSRGGSLALKCPGGVHLHYRPARNVVTFSVRRSCISGIKQEPSVDVMAETEIWTKDGNGVVSVDDIDPHTVTHS